MSSNQIDELMEAVDDIENLQLEVAAQQELAKEAEERADREKDRADQLAKDLAAEKERDSK